MRRQRALLRVEDRFAKYVDREAPLPDDERLGRCHVWIGATDRYGYGGILLVLVAVVVALAIIGSAL